MLERITSEIKEKLGVRVYSGDTVGNFILAASIGEGNIVQYDKSKLPLPAHRETYSDASGAGHPIYRAVVKAKELGDTPLIMEGYVSRTASYTKRTGSGKYCTIELPPGEVLPVSTVWIPKSEEWKTLDFVRDPVVLQDLFVKEDPVILLKNNL